MVLSWTSVDRRFEHVVLEGVGQGAFDVSDDSRYDSDYGVCHDGCCQFSTREHIVAYAYLSGDEMFSYSVVNAFVVSADDDDILLEAEFVSHGLVELFAIRGCEYYLVIVAFGLEGCDASVERLALYEHASSSTEGVVVHTPVFVGSVVSEVVDMYFCQSFLLGSSEDGLFGEGLYEFGQDSDDVYAHL